MAARPHTLEGASLELDHLHTHDHQTGAVTDASPRGTRRFARLRNRASSRRRHESSRHTQESRRATLSSVGLVGGALAVLLAGGAMLSSASGAPSAVVDPQANTVRAVGGAPSFGPATGLRLNDPLVGIAATPSGRGYWAVAADGGVFTFGDAPFEGSVAEHPIAAPIVGLARTPSGHGYWLVGSDGGVFSFGDAKFFGSIAVPAANISPIVAIAPTPSGNGYWLAGSDGAVFSFGDAAFEGAATSFRHSAPIVAMAPTSSGYGYYLLGADGGLFSFGDARFMGSAKDGHHLTTSITVLRRGGYQIASTDGSVVGLRRCAVGCRSAGLPRRSTPGHRHRGSARWRCVARDGIHPAGAGRAPTRRRRMRSSGAPVRTSPTRRAATAPSARTASTAGRTSSCPPPGTTLPAPRADPTSSVSTRPRHRRPIRTSSRSACSSTAVPDRGADAVGACHKDALLDTLF